MRQRDRARPAGDALHRSGSSGGTRKSTDVPGRRLREHQRARARRDGGKPLVRRPCAGEHATNGAGRRRRQRVAAPARACQRASAGKRAAAPGDGERGPGIAGAALHKRRVAAPRPAADPCTTHTLKQPCRRQRQAAVGVCVPVAVRTARSGGAIDDGGVAVRGRDRAEADGCRGGIGLRLHGRRENHGRQKGKSQGTHAQLPSRL